MITSNSYHDLSYCNLDKIYQPPYIQVMYLDCIEYSLKTENRMFYSVIQGYRWALSLSIKIKSEIEGGDTGNGMWDIGVKTNGIRDMKAKK